MARDPQRLRRRPQPKPGNPGISWFRRATIDAFGQVGRRGQQRRLTGTGVVHKMSDEQFQAVVDITRESSPSA